MTLFLVDLDKTPVEAFQVSPLSFAKANHRLTAHLGLVIPKTGVGDGDVSRGVFCCGVL